MNMRKYFERFGHTCEWEVEEELVKFLAGKSRLKQTCIKWTTLDIASNSAQQHFNSYSAIVNEMKFHLENHPTTIHPFSRFKQLWELFMIAVFLCGLIYSPLQYLDYVDMNSSDAGNIRIMKSVKILCIIDMALRFFMGHLDEPSFAVSIKLFL